MERLDGRTSRVGPGAQSCSVVRAQEGTNSNGNIIDKEHRTCYPLFFVYQMHVNLYIRLFFYKYSVCCTQIRAPSRKFWWIQDDIHFANVTVCVKSVNMCKYQLTIFVYLIVHNYLYTYRLYSIFCPYWTYRIYCTYCMLYIQFDLYTSTCCTAHIILYIILLHILNICGVHTGPYCTLPGAQSCLITLT